eukprot:3581483-Karenia_brevis.AAC.1
MADVLASRGADQHAVPHEMIQQARCRSLLARSVQGMMIEIVQARGVKLQPDLSEELVIDVSDTDEADVEIIEGPTTVIVVSDTESDGDS